MLCAATVAGFLARAWWLCELTTHFRPHLAVALTALAGLWLLRGRRGWALVWAGFARINLAAMAPHFAQSKPAVAAEGFQLRLVSVNVHSGNPHNGRVLEFLRTAEADVILLMEVTARWLDALEPLRATHPYQVVEPREDDFGIALFSRLPLAEAAVIELGGAEVPSLAATMVVGGQEISLLGTHPLPPGTRTCARERNAQLRAIAGHVRRQERPVIVVGDLNTTPWSPYFGQLLRDGGLTPGTFLGGLRGSWPAWLPVGKIRLDHCLVTPGIGVAREDLGPRVGGDHLPLVVELRIQPASRQNMNPANPSNMAPATSASARLK